MICNTVLDALGNTPMIRLNRMTGPEDAEILVKYEGLNIGGSIKTRTAFQMVRAAEDAGILTPDSVIVESRSKPSAAAVLLICSVRDLVVQVSAA